MSSSPREDLLGRREEREKNKVLREYARDKLKKHIEMENSMVDQNELYAFSKYSG